jgi:hypothetical protein
MGDCSGSFIVCSRKDAKAQRKNFVFRPLIHVFITQSRKTAKQTNLCAFAPLREVKPDNPLIANNQAGGPSRFCVAGQ